MNDKIKSALSVNESHPETDVKKEEAPTDEVPISKITTTQEEMESYYAVKSMIAGILDATDITYKDTESYFAICFRGMVTKWICRLVMSGTRKQLIIGGTDKTQQKIPIECVDDLFKYRDAIVESAKRFAAVTVS